MATPLTILREHIPFRMCVGCRSMKEKPELIRIVVKDGNILIDDNQKEQCRGIYLCKNKECVSKAQKRKAFSNILKGKVPDEFLKELDERIGK